MGKPIAIVFGVGKNIGVSTVQTFKNKGYLVAQAARSLTAEQSDEVLSIPCDLSNPSSVSTVFEKVRKTWGEPSVVIYNAGAWHVTRPEESLSVSTEDFASDLAINTTSPFVAAREALASFQTQPADKPRTYIFTGNMGNEGPIPGYLSLGLGKTAAAYFIELADSLHKAQAIRFFYVDERNPNGTPMFTELGGQAHADMFLELVERTAADVPWQVTFVAGQGYKEFPHEILM